MVIGIDIDNTISNTADIFNERLSRFCKEKDISVDEFNDNINYIDEFHREYLVDIFTNAKVKNYFKDVFSRIKQNNKIIIITARSYEYFKKYCNMEEITKDWLNRNEISYDKYYSNAYMEDKAKICKREKVDLMIDDDLNNYLALKEAGINTLLFDDERRYLDIVDRVDSWKDVEKYLKS